MNLNKIKELSKRHPHWAVVFVVMFALIFYWGIWAKGRYVSEAHVVIDSPQINMQTMNITSLLSGAASAGDLLLLRDHMLSVDMMIKLEEQLSLREHFTGKNIDRPARLSGIDVPMEKFHAYMLERIRVEFDDYAGVLRIQAQAYDPVLAQRITQTLIAEGEQHMNEMGQRLALEQVRFIEEQADELEQRLFEARDNLLAFQNEHGLVSPSGTVEAIFTTVAELEAQIAVLGARDKALADFQSPTSPERVRLQSELRSLREQAEIERAKLASVEGNALNRLSSEFETLQLRAQFALEMYSTTLAALEGTRVEAARTLKQISVLQQPSMPQYRSMPRRAYNITIVLVFGIFIGAIAHLTRAIIRDHRA
ncbi:MAG: polysaccharide copolymerase KpsE [Idiomarinaceae bacterium HL-53]|nr:MAG: polysaccharide copolymerase KpsE [Idiomarinaceae bacterium HL-53]CUS47124.1 capsular polysaccharide transport system permease protein [Idiomarinaceae bacterium HL-53]